MNHSLSSPAYHLPHPDRFVDRHLGPRDRDLDKMLELVGASSLASLIDEVVPEAVRRRRPLDLPAALSETEVLDLLKSIASKNKVNRSLIGQGYYDCITPAVIQRNILENPGWA